MKIMEKKTTFGLIVGTRGFFNPALAVEARKQLLTRLDALGYSYVIPAEDATPNGAIETLADAKLCADVFKQHAEEIDGIVVVLPNFGDELAVVNTLAMAKLDVPVLVQACDDDLDKLSISQRRDSWCGKLSVCNNLYQYGIPFTNTSRHTCSIESDIFAYDLERFSRVCRVVKGLTNLRVGAIGARPAAFQTMRFSEKLLQETGITVVPVDFSEIMFAAMALDDGAAEVKAKMDEIYAYGTIPPSIHVENILKQAKLSVTVERWMAENECEASGIQCWTSVEQNYGCATCLTMSMMGEKFMPSACEVDVAGVVAMYALQLASGQPAALQDWNNNYGDDEDKCINVHCSNYPKSFIGKEEIEISNLDVLGLSLGFDRCFGAVKAQVAAGPMTFFRMSTDDSQGLIKAYVGEGEFTDDPCTIDGGSSVCKVEGMQDLMDFICKNGFEHHVALTRTHCADVLEEAISTYLDWDLYRHE